MTRFMVPRYVEIIDAFPKTQATERIIKAELRSRGIGPRTWDRERQQLVGQVRAGAYVSKEKDGV